MASRVWIVGTGRSGTTILIQILSDLGMDYGEGRTGNLTEFDGMTRVNGKIIWSMFSEKEMKSGWMRSPLHGDWKSKLYCDEISSELKEEMIEVGQSLPEVVKDPRWSVTLPTWLRFVPLSILPNHIIRIHRPTRSCAWSTAGFNEKRYSNAYEAVVIREDNMDLSMSHVNAKALNIHHIHFPEFLLDHGRLVEVMKVIRPDIDSSKVRNSLKKLVNYDRIEESLRRVIPDVS